MLIQTENTENPATVKFMLGRAVLVSGTVEFGNAQSAEASPLARRLFEIGSVTRIVLGSDFILVTKADDVDWQHLKPVILGGIIEHCMSGDPVLIEQEVADEGMAIDFEPETNEVVAQLEELIATRIRPAAAQTGGDVTFRGYKQGVVYVDMQGSGFSLREGIIRVLQHYVPEVIDVRDYRDAIPKPGLKTPEAATIQRILDDRINPSVAAHGGHISLVDVRENTTYIRLEGGCQGCGMADVTLKQGIEHEIKRAVPTIKAVLDVTDHAGGTNPYYQPGKSGASPF
jgi:Fe-S cluster biogenesis protein NfuA